MEADWDEVSRIAVPPPSPHVLPTIATAIAFDDLQELLWAGNEYVSIVHGMLNVLSANMELQGTNHFFLRARASKVHLNTGASGVRRRRTTVPIP